MIRAQVLPGLACGWVAVRGGDWCRLVSSRTAGIGEAVRGLRRSLPQAPQHRQGCALCGREEAVERAWWPGDERDGSGGDGVEPVVLGLCDIFPGLLKLVDGPGREGWWCARHQSACLDGMHALLRGRAGVEDAPRAAKARKSPRLTELHTDLLARVSDHGALSSVDLARAPSSQSHQDCRWWDVRLAHLVDHRLIIAVRDGADGDLYGCVRATSDLERDLAGRMRALHVPGPVWDGERVVEPEPPGDDWVELSGRAGQEAARLDREALRRRADHPVPEAPRDRW